MAGRTLPLSPQRRLVSDLMWISSGVPVVTFQRIMEIAPLWTLRSQLANPPSWTSMLIKAFSLLAVSQPEFRRIYVPFPFSRIYEHDQSIARIAVERKVDGEMAVLFGRLLAPETQNLDGIDWELDQLVQSPLEEITSFVKILRVSALPRPIRRLMWLAVLNMSCSRRAKMFGTFAISNTGNLGSWAVQLRSPCSLTLHCGPIDEAGRVIVYMSFDHRVHDGAPIARALSALEGILVGPICDELRLLPKAEPGEP